MKIFFSDIKHFCKQEDENSRSPDYLSLLAIMDQTTCFSEGISNNKPQEIKKAVILQCLRGPKPTQMHDRRGF